MYGCMDVIYIRYGYGKGSESLGVWSTAGSVRWESVVMPVQKKRGCTQSKFECTRSGGYSQGFEDNIIFNEVCRCRYYGCPQARLRLDEGYCGLNP